MTNETSIAVEPIPGNPGYVADITGHLADPESDPRGIGATRMAAALDLARTLLDDANPCACLAIAAVLREDMPSDDGADPAYAHAYRAGIERAIRTVEGIA